ncbi:MAG TPA: hypothetical protein VKE51_14320 [Vicinamibacterales bacterium]|nr:hypothetical protein [Vicinamibacterales bacterium]
MVTISIDGDQAVFEVQGFDKLWALRSRLQLPLAHIISVEANADQVGRWWHGFKVLGTDVPGLLGAGTFYYHGELVFWDVHDPANAIILSLDHERYKKLIIEVENPTEAIAQLQSARDTTRSRL